VTARATIPLHLAADELADLAAIAAASRVPLATLARQIVQEYIGPRRVTVDRGRRDAAERLAILRLWWSARKGGAAMGFRDGQCTAQFLAKLGLKKTAPKVCRATLYNWEKRYQGHGLAGLVDGRQVKPERDSASDPFIREFENLYRGCRRPLLSVCYRAAVKVAMRHKWPVTSYRQACRLLKLRRRPGGRQRNTHRGGDDPRS
jgi:hypothetical protein